MTTDLRAALREAISLLREDARDHIDDARKQAAAPLLQMAERLEALADAPPTVAESDAAKDRDDARSWRNAIEGAKEPGDPVLRAIAELLSCTYLDAVPTPADDDMRRELAVAAKVANDERRAKLGEGAVTYSEKRDAAKWRRVEPLIERLREVANIEGGDTMNVVDAAMALLHAANETP